MAEIKGLINAKGKGGSATPTKIFIADADYITITQDDLGSWSFPTSEIEDIEFLTPQSEDYPTESDFADGDLLYVYSEEVVEEDGDPVEIKRTLQELYEVRYIEDNSVVLQKRILIPQSSGGKQLYQHNIRLSKRNSNEIYNLLIQIPNSNSEEMDANDLLDFLNTNGYVKDNSVSNYEQNMYRLSGSFRDLFSSPQTSKQFCGVIYNDSTSIYAYILSGNDLGMSLTLSTMTIKDTVIEL